jgi:riboflavin-specific deaminase-like protein
MKRPWISINLAISVDGKICSTDHLSSGWTSTEDHARLLELRRGKDALMVGMGTLLEDTMALTVPDQDRQPLRCVVSRNRAIPKDHPVFLRAGGEIHLLQTEVGGEPSETATLHRGSLLDFITVLKDRYAVNTLHCEGGGTLIRALAELDAIDEIHLTMAGHTLFGGTEAPTLSGVPGAYFANSMRYSLTQMIASEDGSEVFLSYQRSEAQ